MNLPKGAVSRHDITIETPRNIEAAVSQKPPELSEFYSRLTKKIQTDNAVQKSKLSDSESTGASAKSVLFGYVIDRQDGQRSPRVIDNPGNNNPGKKCTIL